MAKISVNPARRQLRSALVRILSNYARSKGLDVRDLSREPVGTRTSRRMDGAKSRPETHAPARPDLVWLHRGRAIWEFHILKGSRTLGRLGVNPKKYPHAVICADSAGNVGFIEPARLLGFLEREGASTDADTVRSLKNDVPATPAFTPNLHFTGVVRKNHHFLKDHFSLGIRVDSAADPAPGQFLHILCDPASHAESLRYKLHSLDAGRRPKLRGMELLEKRPFLRRPFSIASYGPPSQSGSMKYARLLGAEWLRLVNWVESEFEVIYRRLPDGPGTGALAAYGVGDEIDVVGPLGKGFTIAPLPEVALLVGGGIGSTPLLFLAEELARDGVDVKMFLGAVSRARLPFRLRGEPKRRIPRLERLGLRPVICTDDGSAGLRALVTEPLAGYLEKKAVSATKIYACGPRPMLAALEGIAARHNVPCEVLLEERMACGFGACISCVCGVKETGHRTRYTRICTEGPAFDVGKVMWHA